MKRWVLCGLIVGVTVLALAATCRAYYDDEEEDDELGGGNSHTVENIAFSDAADLADQLRAAGFSEAEINDVLKARAAAGEDDGEGGVGEQGKGEGGKGKKRGAGGGKKGKKGKKGRRKGKRKGNGKGKGKGMEDDGGFRLRQEDVRVEMGLVALAAAYFVCYLWGQWVNSSVAHAWYAANVGILEANFAAVSPLRRDTPGEFSVYCTGRENLRSAIVTVRTRPRHDLASLLLEMVYSGATTDSVIATCTFKMPLAPIVFAALPSRNASRTLASISDLAEHATLSKFATLPEGFAAAANVPSVMSSIVSRANGRVIESLKEYFTMLHVTDLSPWAVDAFTSAVNLQYSIAPRDVDPDSALLVMLFDNLIDKIAKIKLSEKVTTKILAARQEAAEKATGRDRQTILAEQKEAKLRAEMEKQEAKIRSLPPKEAKRYREKLERKKTKKAMNKMRRLVRA